MAAATASAAAAAACCNCSDVGHGKYGFATCSSQCPDYSIVTPFLFLNLLTALVLQFASFPLYLQMSILI
jgi:hypothetical protein